MAKTQTKSTGEKATEYVVVLNVMGKKMESRGATVTEALQKLKPNTVGRSKGILTVSKGKESRDRVLTHMAVSRLLSPSKLAREIAIKNTSLLFSL